MEAIFSAITTQRWFFFCFVTSLRQNRYELPSEFPLTSPYSGIVHHLSGPNRYAPTQIFFTKGSRSVEDAALRPLPSHFHYALAVCHPKTRAYVRLLGPCFKTGRLRPFRQHPERGSAASRHAPASTKRHCTQSRPVCQHTPHLAQPSGPRCVLLRCPQSPRLPKKACAVSPPVSGYLPRPRLQPGKLMLTRPGHKCTASTFGPGLGTLALSPKPALQTHG